MMWIAGVKPMQVLEAYVAAVPALLFFGVVAARQQHAFQPILKDAAAGITVDKARLGVVAAVLAAAIAANVAGQYAQGAWLASLPAIGLAVWAALLVFAPLVRPDWSVLPSATRGGIFLVSLVLCASMMPIEALPAASWQVALGLGFVSAVFDNIPLDSARAAPRGRLGLSRLRRRLRRLDDLVRLLGGGRGEPVSRSPLGESVGHGRMACRRRLCPRLFHPARRARLASGSIAVAGARAPGATRFERRGANRVP